MYSSTFDDELHNRLTAAVVRSVEIRRRFSVICWQVAIRSESVDDLICRLQAELFSRASVDAAAVEMLFSVD